MGVKTISFKRFWIIGMVFSLRAHSLITLANGYLSKNVNLYNYVVIKLKIRVLSWSNIGKKMLT